MFVLQSLRKPLSVVSAFGAALLLCENSTRFWPCHSGTTSTFLSKRGTFDLVLNSAQT